MKIDLVFWKGSLSLCVIMELRVKRAIVYLIVVLGYVSWTNAYMTEAQLKQAGKTIKNVCLPKSGANKEDIAKLTTGNFDVDDKVKCYIGCVMGMIQVVKGTKVSTKMIKTQAAKMLEPELGARVVKAFEACEGASGANTCELAFNVGKCIYEHDPGVLVLVPM